MTRWIQSNWFLIALAGFYLLGHFGAERLAWLADQSAARSMVVMLVMWAMGITLKADAIRNSMARPKASMLAILCNIFLVPILCLPAMWVLSPQIGGGLFVAGVGAMHVSVGRGLDAAG